MARGKKIDEWEFEIDSVIVVIPVYMQKAKYETQFNALAPQYELNMWDKDINKLKDATRDELAAKLSVVWERFIYVTFCGVNDQPTVYDDDNAEELAEKQLTGEFEVFSGLQYEIVEITTRGDGDKMHRHLHGNYGSRALSGLPHTGVEARNLHYDWKPTTSALIPYTPENIEALETIRGQFIALNKLLKDRFMPDKIDALLTEVTSSKLRLMYTP